MFICNATRCNRAAAGGLQEYQGSWIAHITIKDIIIDGKIWDISHVPIEYNSLIHSLVRLKEDVEIIYRDDEFEEALLLWKKDNGGVWNISLIEIIESTLNTISTHSDECSS